MNIFWIKDKIPVTVKYFHLFEFKGLTVHHTNMNSMSKEYANSTCM